MKLFINIIWIWTLVALAACQKESTPKPVLKLVEQRMKSYAAERDSICRYNATKRAEEAVDSFFLTLRRQYLHDSINVPSKPIKPFIDTAMTLDKSSPVKPLWDTFPVK